MPAVIQQAIPVPRNLVPALERKEAPPGRLGMNDA